MFIGREKELQTLRLFLQKERKAALIFGKRRVGKSTLVMEAAKSFGGIVIYKEMTLDSEKENMAALCRQFSLHTGIFFPSFSSLKDIAEYAANTLKQKILIILDEYQNLREVGKNKVMDSKLQEVIDLKNNNLHFIITGSSVRIIESLLEEDNPLYGRFDTVINLKDMDYLESSLFFPESSPREKAEFYAVFGGSPYVLENIDPNESLENNIKRLLLSSQYSFLVNLASRILTNEISKVQYLNQILKCIGNGKRKYSEIADNTNLHENGKLARYLNILVDMDILSKSMPINRKTDVKKTFYSIKEPILRVYFAYLYGNMDTLLFLGEDTFFESYIKPSLDTYISYRFEQIANEYFSRKAKKGLLPGITDIGAYWYDDKENKTNGEFDVALEFGNSYQIYEVKALRKPLDEKLIEEEAQKIRRIAGLSVDKIGFISMEGFEGENHSYEFISAEDMYDEKLL